MSRVPARFTEADVKRALRAAASVKATVAVEITRDGTIRLVPVSSPVHSPSGPEIAAKRKVVL